MQRATNYFYFGLALASLYIIQEVLQLKLPLLEQWQADESYRRWSGFVVALFIVYQWSLFVVKSVVKNPLTVEKHIKLHTWIGALSPLLFYAHSTHVGYAYLLLLSISFYANYLLGMVNLDVVKNKPDWYFQVWMISHVSLSVLITVLMFFHTWIVFYYN